MSKLSDRIERKFINTIEIDDWNIESDSGWVPISHIHKTISYQEWVIETESGYKLWCADTHIIFDEYFNEIYVQDCIPNKTKIITKTGSDLVISVIKTEKYSNMYDLTVESDTHRFYTGEILSHNSTVTDAITYALFGKPFRDIKLNQLINSINGKHCVVTIEFIIGNKQYKVIRGMKPAVFEIYCDGLLLNQDAATKDYQKLLEQQILRTNYKTFCQVVILGAASFVPFMQLKAAQRREVVEDILDIGIFSNMNQLLKDRISLTKSQLITIDNEIKIIKAKIESQNAIISTLSTVKTDTINQVNDKIKLNNDTIDNYKIRIDELTSELTVLNDKISDKQNLTSKLQEVNNLISKYNNSIKQKNGHIHFFDTNDVCFTCSQHITHDYKTQVVSDLNIKINEDSDKLGALEKGMAIIQSNLNKIELVQKEITSKNIELSTINNSILLLNKQNSQYMKEISDVENDTSNINLEKTKLKELAALVIEKLTEKNTLTELRSIQDASSLLLKDTGVKTAIIREYLPVMNTLINKNLATMDSYIKFELDESFNETIKSRYRDDFTYSSFSEGEKKRIDVSILFAWRSIATMKNSLNTNLLIMDEIAESLDADGVDTLLQLLNDSAKNTNTFIISHKGLDQIADKFHSILTIEKKNDFSVIV